MITVTNRLNIKDMASRVMMKVFLLSLGAEFSNSEVPSTKFKLVGLRDHGAKPKFHLIEVGDGDDKTGVSANSRSRPFPRMKACDSLSRIM